MDQDNNIIEAVDLDAEGAAGIFEEIELDQNVLEDISEVIRGIDPDFRMHEANPTQHMGAVRPTVEITEQPASKALRFRYECEGRSAGSIPGVNSTPEVKTYPSIKVRGYVGRAIVVVSCVTKDAPYRPHPHNLVGRDNFRRGVCTVEINNEDMSYTFSNLGIQCVKRKDIDGALRVREEIRVDPFRTGFGHSTQPATIDLNAVRLCFQVFLEHEETRRPQVPLAPVVSDIIYDKKAMSDLVICELSDCTAPVSGGKRIILLCEKVAKEDISIRFTQKKNNRVVWTANADFQPSNVHKQVAITFKTPRYGQIDIEEPVDCEIELLRPSDGATSEPRKFQFTPEPDYNKRKRHKSGPDASLHLLKRVLKPDQDDEGTPQPQFPKMEYMNLPMDPIKAEPRDTSPTPFQHNTFGGTMTIRNQYRISESSSSPQPLSPAGVMGLPQYQQPTNATGFNLLPQQSPITYTPLQTFNLNNQPNQNNNFQPQFNNYSPPNLNNVPTLSPMINHQQNQMLGVPNSHQWHQQNSPNGNIIATDNVGGNVVGSSGGAGVPNCVSPETTAKTSIPLKQLLQHQPVDQLNLMEPSFNISNLISNNPTNNNANNNNHSNNINNLNNNNNTIPEPGNLSSLLEGIVPLNSTDFMRLLDSESFQNNSHQQPSQQNQRMNINEEEHLSNSFRSLTTDELDSMSNFNT